MIEKNPKQTIPITNLENEKDFFLLGLCQCEHKRETV